MEVFAPIEISMPSLQHKHPVIIYDSKRWPGRSSEWYFHKENRISGYSVYRCVRCKSDNEKAKRSGKGSLGAPARIYVQNDHFMCDPDFPVGEHLCNFENNPDCESSHVYAKRAILEANMDMRQNPEQPISKYVKMLTMFENDNSNYAHLDEDTRRRAQTLLNRVGQGFNARKRGLKMNYLLGKRQKMALEQIENTGDQVAVAVQTEANAEADGTERERSMSAMSQDDVVDIEATDDADLNVSGDADVVTHVLLDPPGDFVSTTKARKNRIVKDRLPCGCGDCDRYFKSTASRTRHRTKMHKEMTFLDTEEDLYIFRKTLEDQGVTDVLTEPEVPPLPFAVHWTPPPPTLPAETYDEAATNTAIFQSNISDLLNSIHNLSFFLPSDKAVHSQLCDDLNAIIEKYAPLQAPNVEDVQEVEETVELEESCPNLLPNRNKEKPEIEAEADL
uniref:C2H2-type domain-containing protein n=1 Tax=Panagrellus redivivus TaxID=6233 RepID=A0A7E4VGG4_PANRE